MCVLSSNLVYIFTKCYSLLLRYEVNKYAFRVETNFGVTTVS